MEPKIVKMPAQEFATLRKAAFKQFGDLKRFKEWLRGKHIILEGLAYDTSIEEDEKWSNQAVEQRW